MNIRIFAATNKNLMELVGEHKFREDLFYRLNVLTLKIPPLRERVEDIPDLANLFLRKAEENAALPLRQRRCLPLTDGRETPAS